MYIKIIGAYFFMIQFIIGLFIGANISLFLYVCISTGSKADKEVIQYENMQNYSKK